MRLDFVVVPVAVAPLSVTLGSRPERPCGAFSPTRIERRAGGDELRIVVLRLAIDLRQVGCSGQSREQGGKSSGDEQAGELEHGFLNNDAWQDRLRPPRLQPRRRG